MSTPPLPATTTNRRPWWPWLMLGLGLLWTILIRIPLIVNAEDHLDSDLSVDGLTLLDALHGRWRWHYPGTPYMGILPMLSSYAQALIWGANPVTLVSGGTVLWVLVVVATFWMAWRTFGPEVAGWSIVPLVFSSLGTIWLSGRITGGHLLALVWHTVAFGGLCVCLARGGWRRAAGLGVWCGLGLYVDAMFLFTLAGLVPAAGFAWLRSGRPRLGIAWAAAFLVGLVVGLVPREAGRLVDPYDAYPSQFATTFDRAALLGHARLLVLNCLPRLIAGPELSDLPRGVSERGSPPGPLPGPVSGGQTRGSLPGAGEWASVVVLAGFAVAVVQLLVDSARSGDPARQAVVFGASSSAFLIVAAFLINRNIFNSDNYRYLIFLLTPWALGFGLAMHRLARKQASGRIAAYLVAGLLALIMSERTFSWYRDTRHYLDDRGRLLRGQPAPWTDLTLRMPRQMVRFEVPSDVTHVFGGYWEVYRMAFLSGKRVKGIPFPMYPNRFPGWSEGLGPDRGMLLILRPNDDSNAGARSAAETPGGRSPVLRSAKRIDWRPAFTTVWKADGRDPAEIEFLQVVVP